MLEESYDKKIKFVLFDIFDTLVSRKIQPEYVKKIWVNQLIKYFKLELEATNLYFFRNKVEEELGNENLTSGNDCEITYESIIKRLHKELNIKIPYKKFLNGCKVIEINIESKVLIPDQDIIKEIKKLRKEGKKIICVSDMYLSQEMIENIFENLGIKKLFDNVFVSCEYLKNKKTGKLYDIVLKKLNTKPDNCIMIGDNYYSDYEIPRQKGIKSIHLKRDKNYEFYEQYLNTHSPKIVYNEVVNLSKTNNDDFEHSIFSLYNFIEKLYYELLVKNEKEVFFLSREGEYLKKLFDYYCDNIFGKKIDSHYLYVSRKATYLPSLKKIEDEDFSSLLNQYSYITIVEFLKSLNFEKEEVNQIIDSYKKDAKLLLDKFIVDKNYKKQIEFIITDDVNKKIPNFIKSGSLKVLKNNETFKKIYEKNRVEQKNNFIKYINQKTKNKHICVVDIGWNGSIQNNIQNILGDSYTVEGFYFGMNRRNKKEKIKKYGLMFTTEPKNKEFDLYNQNRSLYEIILGASHGSANKYINKGKKIEISLFSLKEEKNIYEKVIKPLQDRMFEIYKQIVNLLANGYYDNYKVYKLFNKIQYEMLFHPNKKQLQFFNKIYHYENFGVFEFTEFNIKNKIGIKRYIKENLKFVLRYSHFFDDSFWPALKLKNLKLYIPYFIYVAAKKIKFKKKDLI